MDPQKSIILPVALSILGTAVIVGGGAYYVGMNQSSNQPSPVYSTHNSTATPTVPSSSNLTLNTSTSWSSYTNQQLGFSLEYPKGWLTKEFSSSTGLDSQSKGIHFRPNDPSILSDDYGLVNVQVEQAKADTTVDNYLNNYFCDSPGVCVTSNRAESVTVSGIVGKKVNPPGPILSEMVVVLKDKKIYTISVNLDDSFKELDKQAIYSHILSTFKFSK